MGRSSTFFEGVASPQLISEYFQVLKRQLINAFDVERGGQLAVGLSTPVQLSCWLNEMRTRFSLFALVPFCAAQLSLKDGSFSLLSSIGTISHSTSYVSLSSSYPHSLTAQSQLHLPIPLAPRPSPNRARRSPQALIHCARRRPGDPAAPGYGPF